jgi:ABC-type nitrate/sulfonate/bicarbonate transport system permease component
MRNHDPDGVPIYSSRERYYRVISILSPVTVLILWEGLVRFGVLDDRFFPPPSEVLVLLVEMVLSGEILVHLAASLQRIILGFLLGAVPGIMLGLIMGWFKGARAFMDPIVATLYPIPKISILPLLLIIFGLGEASKIFVVAIAGFFIILITTAHGVMRIDHTLIQAAQNYGATGGKLFTRVILPASLPAIFTGLRLSLGVSLLVIVSAEIVASNRGLGYLIWMAWSTLTVKEMYVGLVVIGILGLLFTNGVEHLGKLLMPWAQDIQDRSA